MYRCPRLVNVPVVVEMPETMYKAPLYNVNEGNKVTSSQPVMCGKMCPDVTLLEARQDAVLRRLQELKQHLDLLQSTRLSTTTATTTTATTTITTTAATTTTTSTVLGAAAHSSPYKPCDLVRQQESVLYRLALLKDKLTCLSDRKVSVDTERPLTLPERQRGIVEVIKVLREELRFLSDLQKWMADKERNEDDDDNNKNKKKKKQQQEDKDKKEEEEEEEEGEEEEEVDKHHQFVLRKILALKDELKLLVERLRTTAQEEEERDVLSSLCTCLDLPPLPSTPSSSSSLTPLPPPPPPPPSLPSSSSLPSLPPPPPLLPSTITSSSSLASLLPPPPPLPSSSSSSSSSSSKMDSAPGSSLQDLVISASPSFPPLSLLVARGLLKAAGTPVLCSSRVHSSIAKVSESLQAAFTDSPLAGRTQHCLAFSVHWTDTCTPCLMVSPLRQTTIRGEANVLRYIARLFPASSSLNYEATGTYAAIAETDELLDGLERDLRRDGGKERQAALRRLAARLVRSPFLCGGSCGIADLLAWSLLRQRGHVDSRSGQELVKWMEKMDALAGLDLDSLTEQQPNKQTTNKKQTAAAATPKVEEKKVSSTTKGEKHFGRKDLEAYLKELGIPYQCKEHKEVFTVEELMKEVEGAEGVVTKNLFLRDKKKKLYLLSTKHDTEIDLKTIAKKIGTKDLRFADESLLLETLGVRQGCVSAFALLNDASNHLVQFLVEAAAVDPSVPLVHFHPLVNDATLGLTPNDLTRFLAATGHTATLVTLP